MNKKLLTAGSVIVGIILIIIGGVYLMKTAGNLPSFFPGYMAGATNIHIKHGIASILLGLALFVYAWFASAKKAEAPTKEDSLAN